MRFLEAGSRHGVSDGALVHWLLLWLGRPLLFSMWEDLCRRLLEELEESEVSILSSVGEGVVGTFG